MVQPPSISISRVERGLKTDTREVPDQQASNCLVLCAKSSQDSENNAESVTTRRLKEEEMKIYLYTGINIEAGT